MKSILSIQSHVAYGFVGNKSAVFPLQNKGFDVWPVHTVQFSNHTGYGHWRGEMFSPDHVLDVIDGLEERGVLGRCNALLSGYVGMPELGEAVLAALDRVKKANPGAIWCCDPVMGDVGRGFFVAEGVPEFFKDQALERADIITPNQFELNYLTGTHVKSLDDALKATERARALGPRIVLVTSLTRKEAPESTIEMLVDSPEGAWLVRTPRLPFDRQPNGAGDLTAALYTGDWLDCLKPDDALARTTASVFAVFAETRKEGTRELAMIQARDRMRAPDRTFSLEKVR